MIRRDLAAARGRLLAHYRRCLRCGPCLDRLADPAGPGPGAKLVDCNRGRELVRAIEDLLGLEDRDLAATLEQLPAYDLRRPPP